MYEKTLKLLKQSIEQNKTAQAVMLASTIQNFQLDKEFIYLAVKSKNSAIVNSIVKKTPTKHFSKSILKGALLSKNEKIVNLIVPKSHPSFFDKGIVMDAVRSDNGNIVSAIGRRCTKGLFDGQIIEMALKTKNPEVVRATVDNVVENKLFRKYKGQIQKSIFEDKDIQNLAGQILSRSNNTSFDHELQELVLDIYLDVVTSHYLKGKMPLTFPIRGFMESVNQSRQYFNCPDNINFDSLNKENRFLILPVYSYGHAFSAIVKKPVQKSDDISITFVNLGARPFERSAGHGNAYKEFVYKPKDALNVLKDHCYNARIHYPEKAVPTNKAYKRFKANSIAEFNVNVESRNQKVGNCFIKNIEKGLKYALALGLSKSQDKNFTPESLRITRENVQEDKKKVKLLKPIHNEGEKTNDLTTVQLRKQLINSLIRRFPEYKKEIVEEWNIYKERKVEQSVPEPIDKDIFKIKTISDRPVFEHRSTKNKNINDSQFIKKMNTFTQKNHSTNNKVTKRNNMHHSIS